MPTTAVKIGGKSPVVDGASFVAPSANLIGGVHLAQGASAWYSSYIEGTEVGEMSSVGDRAIVVESVVGKSVHIGAGAIVQSAKLSDECSVGMGSVVGKGASIGAGAAIAAGSVLKAGTAVPAAQLWAGNPAKYVSDVSAESTAGAVRAAEITSELAKLHMDEAWKPLDLVEQVRACAPTPCVTTCLSRNTPLWRLMQDHDDYKREAYRTPDFISSLREDPKWVPLPTLGGSLARIGVHDNFYTPP